MQVNLMDAAAVLGVSERTVRRRIANGQLEGTQVAKPRGGYAWLVEMPDSAAVAERPSDVALLAAGLEQLSRNDEEMNRKLDLVLALQQQRPLALPPAREPNYGPSRLRRFFAWLSGQ